PRRARRRRGRRRPVAGAERDREERVRARARAPRSSPGRRRRRRAATRGTGSVDRRDPGPDPTPHGATRHRHRLRARAVRARRGTGSRGGGARVPARGMAAGSGGGAGGARAPDRDLGGRAAARLAAAGAAGGQPRHAGRGRGARPSRAPGGAQRRQPARRAAAREHGAAMTDPRTRLVFVSGLSGSGRTTAMGALEDLGFYGVDNLPPQLIAQFVDLCAKASPPIRDIALALDAREAAFLKGFPAVVEAIRAQGARVQVLFLDCADEVLLNRYRETRRVHPLAPAGTVEQGIERERAALTDLARIADWILDTSQLNVHQ